MMRLQHITSAILLWSVISSMVSSTLVSSSSPNSHCQRIRTCDDFEFVKSDASDVDTREQFGFKNETGLAVLGHSNGVIPTKYKINLKFTVSNDVALEGTVEIEIDLIQRVNRILINAHAELDVDYRSMVIKSIGCTEMELEMDETSTSKKPCIEKVTYLREYETAVVDLRHIDLEPDSKYVIEFPRFKRPPFMHFDPTTTPKAPPVSIFIWTFAHRKAREIFPCFDHLIFKSEFEYCIERDPFLISVSNLPLNPDKSRVTAEALKIDCHHAIRPISTASLGLALLSDEKYDKQFRNIPGSDVQVEVFYGKGTHSRAARILDLTVDYMVYAETLTRYKYPLPKLSVIIWESIPMIGYNSFGVMAMDTGDLPERLFDSLVFMKVMHQWIGNIVTLRDWRELCLHEGLIMYLERRITAKSMGKSIRSVVDDQTIRFDMLKDYEPIGRRMLDIGETNAQFECQMRSALFLYTLNEFYGDHTDDGDIVIELMRALFAKYAYGSASIKEWDQILTEISKRKGNPIERYLQAWFDQPGMLHLLVSKASTDCIRIRQRIVGSSNGTAGDVPSPRPIPIRVHFLDSKSAANSSTPIILTEVDQKICGTKGRAHLVDPNRYSWTRKAYGIDNYRTIVRMNMKYDFLDPNQRENVFVDFCWALEQDMFPLADDRRGTAAAWREVLGFVAASTENSGQTEQSFCHCCAYSIAAGGSNGIPRALCAQRILDDCQRLRIARIVQTFDDEDEGDARDEL